MSGGATLSDNATKPYADPLHAREVGAAVADHEAAFRVRVRDLGPRWEATRSHHHERRQLKLLRRHNSTTQGLEVSPQCARV